MACAVVMTLVTTYVLPQPPFPEMATTGWLEMRRAARNWSSSERMLANCSLGTKWNQYFKVNFLQILQVVLLSNIIKQEAPQCDETRFSTIQPSFDVTGIGNGRWQ